MPPKNAARQWMPSQARGGGRLHQRSEAVGWIGGRVKTILVCRPQPREEFGVKIGAEPEQRPASSS